MQRLRVAADRYCAKGRYYDYGLAANVERYGLVRVLG